MDVCGGDRPCKWRRNFCVLNDRLSAVDSFLGQSHGCVWSVQTMQVETKFLRLCQPAALGEQIDGWKVYWVGGWGKDRLFYYVMVARVKS